MDEFTKYHFKNITSDEHIVEVLHRNWFYLLKQFVLIFFVLGFFFVGLFYLPIVFPELAGSELEVVVEFLENFLLLTIWMFTFLIWVDYYFDIWIITTERIINVEQKGMFSRKASELRYNKIEDVTTSVSGFFPTIINYGDVKVQTAAEESQFLFRTVSNPYHIKNIIMDLHKKAENKRSQHFGDMIKEKISEE